MPAQPTRTAIVTGAARGIGAGVATRLAAGGFTETLRVTVEREGGGKPARVAETVSVLFPEPA